MHEDQAALPAEAARRAGQELGLGELLNVHVKRGNPPLPCCLGALLCLLSPAALLVALGFSAWVLAGLAGVAFAAGCVLNGVGWRKRTAEGWLARYQHGFAQVIRSGPPRAVRWRDVTSVGVAFRVLTTGGTVNVAPSTRTIVSRCYARPCLTSAEPLITERWVRYDQAAGLVADAIRSVGPRMAAALIAAYDAGQPVVLGQVRIDQSGITLPARPGRRGWAAGLVPWSVIRSVNGDSLPGQRSVVHAITVRCEGKPKWRRVSLSGIPNGIFLPAVLRHAATGHGIPVRLGT